MAMEEKLLGMVEEANESDEDGGDEYDSPKGIELRSNDPVGYRDTHHDELCYQSRNQICS